jgi:RNA polymerase sigma-70 factor (ECF subfamily)
MPFVPWRLNRRAPAGAGGGTATEGHPQAEPLRRLAAGDSAALAPLFEAEAARVYRYALGLSGNPAWAADATQEAFVALATRPQQFDPARGTLGAWLAGVARHALLAQWRQARREQPWPERTPADGFDDVADRADAAEDAETRLGASPEALLVAEQDSQAVWDALRALPAPFREAVLLVDLQDRSYAEAAAIAGIEINTLRTRVHRGRLKLAARLAAAGVTP